MTTGELEVGGAGSLGIAFETTAGTYEAPDKWIPIRSETLLDASVPIYRMNIVGTANRNGVIPGYKLANGDFVFEVTADVMPYLLMAARMTVVRTGLVAPFTYTATPTSIAKSTTAAPATPADPVTCTNKTLSVLIQRSKIPMAYLGCSVGHLAFTIDAGVLLCTVSLVGFGEETESTETPSYADSVPFGPGKLLLESPTGTSRPDVDTFSFEINDNGTPQNRLTGSRFAAYNSWGEREVSGSFEHDFENTDDFDAFMAGDISTIHFTATNTADDSIDIVVAQKVLDSYPVHLSGLGNLVVAQTTYHGLGDASNDDYTITVVTNEDVT